MTSPTGRRAHLPAGYGLPPDSPHDLAARLAEAANAKYGLGQSVGDYEGQESTVLRARVVLAWTLLHRDATRFTFG